jgi:hypothetical protein
MHCREVKRQISENAGRISKEIAQHLTFCRSCARAVKANQILRETFESARRQHETAATPFSEIRRQVETMIALGRGQERRENLMSKVKKQYQARPRLTVAMVIALAVFLGATLILEQSGMSWPIPVWRKILKFLLSSLPGLSRLWGIKKFQSG